MNYKQYLTYVKDIADYDSPEIYAAEYGYPADCPVDADNVVKMFEIIHAVAHNDFNALVGSVNLTAYRMGKDYGISTRTTTSWISGERKPPEYVIQLLGYALISELPSEDE